MLQALAGHKGFVVYRLAPITGKPGKTDKIPIDGVTGYNSNAQNPATWLTPDVAQTLAAEWAPIYPAGTGVGIVIYQGSQLFCVDIDGCIVDGVVSPLAQSIVARFPGAVVEISASGTGLHIFGVYVGIIPPHRSKNTAHHIELYTKERFIALTGNYLSPGHVGTDCTAALFAFAGEYFPDAGGKYSGEWTDGPADDWNFITDDDELIQWLASHPNVAQRMGGRAPFDALFNGEGEILGRFYAPNTHGQLYDASSADQGLANILAWGTGNDCERVARIMRRSKLIRSKWDREDYFNGTVANACAAPKQWPTLSRSMPAPSIPTPPPSPPVADGQALDPQQTAPLVGTSPPLPTTTTAPPVPTAMPGSDGVPLRGGVLFTHDQAKWFDGCVYVEDVYRVMMPDGDLLEAKQFDLREPFAGRQFQIKMDNSAPGNSAWEAFTAGLTKFPKVRGQYFEPREAPGAIMVREGRNYVNSWKPITIDATPGDVSWFLDHVRKLLPMGDDAHILVQFLKFMVQHKGEKAAWFPFLQGVEGNGKSFINETMQYCLGERYTHKPRPTELAGRFNSAFYGKLLIAIDDIQLADARHIWETLKPMVDGKRLEIEYKGVDKVTREVCFNIIATSNHKDGIPVTANDRRVAPLFCAQQVESDLERDGLTEQYFIKLWATAAAGGWAAVLHYLSTDAIDPRYSPVGQAVRAPRTSSTFAAKAVTMGAVEQEILEAVELNAHGFGGGWISSTAMDNLLKRNGKDRVISINKRGAMLATLGYVLHPGLLDGRVSTPLTDGTRPRLFLKPSHTAFNLTDKTLIKQLFENAQAVAGAPSVR